ncbi:hypothetical protein ABZP36_002096 [Zizania latifolia]
MPQLTAYVSSKTLSEKELLRRNGSGKRKTFEVVTLVCAIVGGDTLQPYIWSTMPPFIARPESSQPFNRVERGEEARVRPDGARPHRPLRVHGPRRSQAASPSPRLAAPATLARWPPALFASDTPRGGPSAQPPTVALPASGGPRLLSRDAPPALPVSDAPLDSESKVERGVEDGDYDDYVGEGSDVASGGGDDDVEEGDNSDTG